MHWHLSSRFDKLAIPLADRHYTRQKIGTPQFVTPGRCIVLLTADADALWVTSWPEFSRHEWAGAWMCSIFRNESSTLSSELIREAVTVTRYLYPVIPPLGMVTFIDPTKVRHKRDPGRCFLRAGFRPCGRTKVNDLIALQLLPSDMPEPAAPLYYSNTLFAEMTC